MSNKAKDSGAKRDSPQGRQSPTSGRKSPGGAGVQQKGSFRRITTANDGMQGLQPVSSATLAPGAPSSPTTSMPTQSGALARAASLKAMRAAAAVQQQQAPRGSPTREEADDNFAAQYSKAGVADI